MSNDETSGGFRGADWALAKDSAPISLKRGPSTFAGNFFNAPALYYMALDLHYLVITFFIVISKNITGKEWHSFLAFLSIETKIVNMKFDLVNKTAAATARRKYFLKP